MHFGCYSPLGARPQSQTLKEWDMKPLLTARAAPVQIKLQPIDMPAYIQPSVNLPVTASVIQNIPISTPLIVDPYVMTPTTTVANVNTPANVPATPSISDGYGNTNQNLAPIDAAVLDWRGPILESAFLPTQAELATTSEETNVAGVSSKNWGLILALGIGAYFLYKGR